MYYVGTDNWLYSSNIAKYYIFTGTYKTVKYVVVIVTSNKMRRYITTGCTLHER